MKVAEREQVRQLRRQGLSYRRIREIVGVSKSSISLWTRDIELSKEQLSNLKSSQARGREKYSETRRKQREEREAAVYTEAEREYEVLSRNPEFMYGLALYVGEGAKTSTANIVITNCDPRVLKKFIAFLEVLGVYRDEVSARIHLHPKRSKEQALAYWSEAIGLPSKRFRRTVRAASPASRGLRADRRPYGTCRIEYGSAVLMLKLKKWMELSLAGD